ncbi:PQQ-binding-like beta-propeller repeat protein [Nocardioides sp.]|uniref:outer membrane protein assembly factor BamB family protein n=1 Tax=Nocardioides sp. TaxID=35761 RepID=UPI002D0351E7|nr:PQQ-binding-like beta-propeller repeat protein [Nocardioides sp.]HXH77277.1 PQQ-binding-like beta-propeller repeat protein [Nocardioides sp.]
MDDQPLVACGHCGSRNRRTSEQCFICARPLTGLEVEVPDSPPVLRPVPALSPHPAPSADTDAAERMERGPATEEREAEPRRWDGKRRRTAIIAAAAAAVGAVALAGGLWMTRDGESVNDPFALRAAVIEEPDLAWTWDADEPFNTVSAMDQGALVVLTDGVIVALDEDGGERWRRDVPDAGYAVNDEPANVVHVLSSASEERTITALDAETGQKRWAVPGEWVTRLGDATVVVGQEEFRRIDTEDGSEIWSVSIDGFGDLSEDGVYGFKDGDLHAWDLEGDEVWVSDAELADSSLGTGTVAALDDFIAATGPEGEVVAIDPVTGDELWRDDPGYNNGVGSIEPGFAFTYPSSLQGADGPQETTVYDRDGEVATLELTKDPFFSPVAIELDGEPHFVALGSGQIYDEAFEEVGTVPIGNTSATLSGVYDMTGDTLGYVPYGADDPLWVIDVEPEEGPTYVVPSDESFLLIDGSTLSLYR